MACATKKKKRKTSVAIPLKGGCRIVLKRGKGSKRRYNGLEASVVEYPSRGSWMTVATTAENTLKWPKGQCISATSHVDMLGDNLWCHVFEFLVDTPVRCAREQTPTNGIWVRDAQRCHSTLSGACKTWKRLCDAHVTTLFGCINANLDALRTSQVVPHVHWLIKHTAAMGALRFYSNYADIPFLVQLLNVCDTTQLSIVKARCATNYLTAEDGRLIENGSDMIFGDPMRRFPAAVNFSRWISEAHAAKVGAGVIDLSESDHYKRVALRDMCRAINVPYSYWRPKVRDLHDAIASNCNNLSELLVNFDVPHKTTSSNLHRYVSENLFSPDLKCKLHLSLSLSPGIQSSVLNKALEHAVNVKDLSIGCPRNLNCRRICLASKHLKSLDASSLDKNTFIAGNLPNLKTLIYGGQGGVAPVFLDAEEEQRCIDNSLYDHGSHRRTCRFLAGQVQIHGLNLPPECEMITHNLRINQWLLDAVYDAPLG